MSKFLGSSVLSFSTSVTWGGSEISCDIKLADCKVEGDTFNPGPVGYPHLFEYESFQFFGLLDRYTENYSSSSFDYAVNLSNGLFLLQGTKLILNDYYGVTSNVPNLINPFGYLESFSFGNSEVNDAGISWRKVRDSVVYLLNNTSGNVYGNPIKHKGHSYGIDLSNLPLLPDYYRINSESVSILEFIQEVCEAGGVDFFVKLEETLTPGLDGEFKVYTISRSNEPVPGAIENYINSINCLVEKDVGQEIRKDPTSKMVVGANVEQMWFVEKTPASTGSALIQDGEISESEYLNYNVLPYYGNDSYGNYIVGRTYIDDPENYLFDIDISDIAHPSFPSGSYTTSSEELEAAKAGRDSWEAFLAKRSCNLYNISNGTGPVTARPFVLKFPKSSLPNGQVFNVSGPAYAATADHYFEGVPKFGYIEVKRRENTSNLPDSITAGTYYSETIAPESFAATSHAVNSTLNGGKYQRLLYYPSTNSLNPFFGRAFDLLTPAPHAITFARLREDDLYLISTTATTQSQQEFFAKLYNKFIGSVGKDFYSEQISKYYSSQITKPFEISQGNTIETGTREKTTRIFKRLKNLADNYHGKRYIVAIPSTSVAIEPESTKTRLSQKPNSEGYLSDQEWAVGVASGLIPDTSGVDTILTEQDKFYPFVKYKDAITYSGIQPVGVQFDYSEISEQERTFGNAQNSGNFVNKDMWIRCSVLDNTVYYDNSTLQNPRAIIELPGKVLYDPYHGYNSKKVLNNFIEDIATSEGGAFYADVNFSNEKKRAIYASIGGDEPFYNSGQKSIMPDIFAVPLKSNVLTYGPWYYTPVSGNLTDGPVDYEKNEDLAPWNYGGYTGLDLAGFARVNDGVTDQTFDETGSLTIASAPGLNIGDQLISGGPYITDINVSAGANGVRTKYSFQSFSSQRRLSKLTNFHTEKIKRLVEESRKVKRSFRSGFSQGAWSSPAEFFNDIRGRFVNLEELPKRDNSNTSHSVIAAENSSYKSTVVIQPEYNMSTQVSDNYSNKAFVSLDSIFRPYANTPRQSGLPGLFFPVNTGEAGQTNKTSLDYYPLQVGSDISIVAGASGGEITNDGVRGNGLSVEVNSSGVPDQKGIAIKAPAVYGGWGRDCYNEPVPALVDSSGELILTTAAPDSGSAQYDYDYLYNPDKWAYGPFKASYEPDIGMWGFNNVSMAIVSDNIAPPSSINSPSEGWVYDYIPDRPYLNTGRLGNKNKVVVFDKSIGDILPGTIVYYHDLNGIKSIIYAACSADDDALEMLALRTGAQADNGDGDGGDGGGGPLPP